MEIEKALQLYNYFDNWAVIGVSDEESKFGYKIFKRLLDRGKKVYGISPKYDNILGQKLYKDITEVPDGVQVAVFVVNPKISIGEIEKIKNTGIKTLWFQPGTYDEEVLQKANDYRLEAVDKCVLVVSDLVN